MASSDRLFKRSIRVTLARPNGFFSQQGNALVIEKMRVAFKIDLSLDKEPNKAEVIISNLSPDTRAEFVKKPLHVRLEAGYDGNFKQLFDGDLRYSDTRQQGPTPETTLQLGHGERAYRHARVSRSYKRGVTRGTAVREVAKSMGLIMAQQTLNALDNVPFVSGLVLDGPAAKQMDKLLQPQGMGWSVQNGRLVVLQSEEALPIEAFPVSQATGMIGVPEFGTPGDKGKPPPLNIRTLLYPEIFPGCRIQLDSQKVKGLFKVQKVMHSGDTHGTDWYTDIEVQAHQA